MTQYTRFHKNSVLMVKYLPSLTAWNNGGLVWWPRETKLQKKRIQLELNRRKVQYKNSLLPEISMQLTHELKGNKKAALYVYVGFNYVHNNNYSTSLMANCSLLHSLAFFFILSMVLNLLIHTCNTHVKVYFECFMIW